MIHTVVMGRVAIGGSMSLIAHKDATVPAGYQPGDIDLCLSCEEDLTTIHEYLTVQGYTRTLNLPHHHMFTVRAQYCKDGEKHDFFIVPALDEFQSTIDGIQYISPCIVWAARGFYAGVGSHKAYRQLVDGGLVVDNPRLAMSARATVKRIIKDIKYIIQCILSK